MRYYCEGAKNVSFITLARIPARNKNQMSAQPSFFGYFGK